MRSEKIVRAFYGADAKYRCALFSLLTFRAAGYRLIVISNQAGVARGYFEEGALEGVRETLYRLLDAEDVPLDGFYYCPHHPDGKVAGYAVACECRKPGPGMICGRPGNTAWTWPARG